jgi:hypothetical protein
MSDQQDSMGGDDMSGLTGFFFYMFIVHPATAWILKPGRFERSKSIMYAIAFLAGLAAIKTGKFVERFLLDSIEDIEIITIFLFYCNLHLLSIIDYSHGGSFQRSFPLHVYLLAVRPLSVVCVCYYV